MKNLLNATILTLLLWGVLNSLNYFDTAGNMAVFLDPLVMGIKDFELTDIVFSHFENPHKTRVDTNIVYVNFSELPRAGIAQLLRNLERFQPKVIGIDAEFTNNIDPAGTMSLLEVLQSHDNIVLSSRIFYDSSNTNPIAIKNTFPYIPGLKGTFGFVNLSDDKRGFRTIRNFEPTVKVGDSTYEAFSLSIARKFDNSMVEELLKRGNELETINYQRNQSSFRLDVSNVLDSTANLSFVHNKIVLMGFLGRQLNDESTLIDRFFTPLNSRYAGKTYPDIYGLEIHGNVISMMMHRDYVFEMPTWLNILSGMFICILCVLVFIAIDNHLPYFYDLITKTIQVAVILALLVLTIVLFYNYRYAIDITETAFAIFLAGDAYTIYKSAIEAIKHSITSRKGHHGTSS